MGFGELWSKLSYGIEIVAAALVLLQGFPRRKYFPIRLCGGAAAVILISYLQTYVFGRGQGVVFIVYQLTLAMLVIAMYWAFKISLFTSLSACMAGVAVQHIGHHVSRLVALLPFISGWSGQLELAVVLILLVIAGLTFGRVAYRKGIFVNQDTRITIVSVVIILMCTGLTRFLRLAGDLNIYGIVCTSLYAISCSAMALFCLTFLYDLLQVQNEYKMLQHIREEEKQQYEISKENTDFLNVKYHDLKHKLVGLEAQLPAEEIASMREMIETYDSIYHTGNEAFDIVINEKIRKAKNRGITFTCMGGSNDLSFLSAMDIYSLFGNLLDNAIEAAEQLPDAAQKMISLTIERKGNLLYIDEMNYTAYTGMEFKDGLPVTTKNEESGFHGYGLKSIRQIARKHEGDVAVVAKDGIFQVQVYMLIQ